MGSKGSATTTSTSAPPQAVQDMYKYITEQGKTLQQQPYQQYQGQLVPDINATQQAGINQAQQYSQAAQPGYQAGYGATNTAMNQIAQGQNVAQPYYGAATGLTDAAAQQVGMNMNAAQPAYQAGYGAAGQAQDILNQGLGVAQPYFQGAQTFAAGTLPQYQQAAGVAQAGMRPLMQSTYAAQPSYQAAQAGTMAAGAGTGQTIGQLGNISQGYNAPNYQAGVQGYMNPYLQNAMGSTAAMMQNQNQQQQNQLQGNAISQGAFGGDRGNIAQAALMGQQNLAMGQTLGQMANTGYQSAAQNYMSGLGQQGALAGQQGAMYGQLGNLSNQYGLLGGQAQQALINAGQAQQQGAANIANIAGQGMGAASQYGALGTAAQNAALQGMPLAQQQATLYGQLGTGAQNAAMQGAQQLGALGAQYGQLGTSAQNAALQTVPMSLAAGAQYGQLGAGAQTAGMTGAQQLSAAGAIPYAVQQAQDAAQYQQFAQQQAYPWQTLGSLANMASGLGAGQGGSSTATSPAPNSMNSIMGLGTSLLNMSDERTKDNMEPIGKTFDGQNIYKFNYKGDPKTNIGLSAQEVEKRNPNAVHKTEGGLSMVNYDDATSNAANRGHFAGGGSSMGGLVPESMERHPYAYGGVGQSQRQFGETPYADDPLAEEMAALAKITLGSYIPHSNIQGGGGIGLPHAQPYQEPAFDTSGIAGFGKAAYNKYGQIFGISANNPNYIAGAGGYEGMGPFTNSYATGGLVPRIPHADGEVADPEKTVPADQGFFGNLGSSISKGISGLQSTHDQPGLIGNLFNKGEPLSDDARQAIMAAGFGMMASPSPFLSQAIGQGGLIGANTYAKQKQINYETQKALAEQALQGRQVGVSEAGLPLRQQELDIQNRGQALDIYSKFISKYHSDVDSMGNPIMAPTPGSGAPPLTPEEYNAQLNAIIQAAGFSPAVMNALRTSKPRQAQAIGGQSMLPDDGGVQAVVLNNQPTEDQAVPQPIKVAQAAVPNTAGAVSTDASQTGDVNPYPDIHPSGTPTYFRNLADVSWKRYQKLQDMGQDATKAFEAWKSLSEKAEGIANGSQQTLLSDGKTYGFPQSIVQKNLSAASQKAMSDAQNADATKFTTENSKFLEELPAVQQVQDGLINAYQKIDMNRTTGFKADAIGIIKGTPVLDNILKKSGVDVDSDGFQGLADTAAKDAIVNAFKAIAANAGGRTTNMQLKEGLMSVAEPVKAPAAKYQVITQDRSNQLRQEDMARDWIDNINNPNPSQRKTQAKFIADWTRDPTHSQKIYDQKAVDQIDYFSGMTPKDINNLPYKRTVGSDTLAMPAEIKPVQRQPWMSGKGSFSFDPSNNQAVQDGKRYDWATGKEVTSP